MAYSFAHILLVFCFALLLLRRDQEVEAYLTSTPTADCRIHVQHAAPSLLVLNSARERGTNMNDMATEETTNRRRWMQRQIASVGFLSSHMWAAVPSFHCQSHAASAASLSDGTEQEGVTSTWTAVRADLTLVITTLQKLVTNWERAVIDCTYADVPRELLEQKNKELLLEKASTFALFDKSVSVTSCKTVNNRVRDYLGRTGIGPVSGLDSLLKQTTALVLSTDRMDVGEIDPILQTIEEIQRELNRADSFSYSARRDFSSMNNFDPEDTEKVLSDSGSNLALCKAAIETAVDKLKALLNMLPS